jgi:hypothetical protein
MRGILNTINRLFHADKEKDKGYEVRWKEHRKSKQIADEIKRGVVSEEEAKRRFTKSYNEMEEWRARRDEREAREAMASQNYSC